MGAIDLAGKPIAIAGASSGIGAATAIACARAGMPVALGARREDKLRDLVARIIGEGGKAISVGMDVTKPADCERLVSACVGAFGSIYSVYANAGYGEEMAIAEASDEKVRAMFETNFFGTLNVVRAALPHLLKNPTGGGRGERGVRGHVLICSSCLGKMPVAYYGVYSATKAAQHHIARAMNLELKSQGVRVSSVHPIGTRTEFFGIMQERAGEKPLMSLHTPDAMMQSAECVAERTVACLRRPKPEVWTGLKGNLIRYSMAIGGLFPRLTDWSLERMIARSRTIHNRSGVR